MTPSNGPSEAPSGINWNKSLYFRVAAAFATLLMASAAVQLVVTTSNWQSLSAEVEQEVHWDIAGEVATRIQPELEKKVDPDRIAHVLYELAVLNPKWEFFILDASGKILFSMAPQSGVVRKTIDLEPIQLALRDIAPALPLYGDNPRQSGQKQVFSAAPLRIGGERGYLYMMLNSASYEHLSRTTGQYYVVRSVIIGGIVAFLAAILLGFFLFYYLVRHFRELDSAIRNYAKGDFTLRIAATSEDEVGRLAGTINFMAERIEQQTEELKQRDAQRRTLIAAIAHDLRSPLTSVRGFVDVLLHKGSQLGPDEHTRYLEIISESVRSQAGLVNDLFDLSSLEANERTPVLEPCFIDELLEECLHSFGALAGERNIELRLALDDALPHVMADFSMIQRVLKNLIENAIRYTGSGGTVTLQATAGEFGVKTIVTDSGVGISETDLPHIFESFYRATVHHGEDPGGTGLGLAIVKKILTLHGTNPEVESTVGAGTSFSFVLRSGQSNAEAQATQ